MTRRRKNPPPPHKAFSIRFTSDGLDCDAAGIKKTEAAPQPGETTEDAMQRVLERIGVSLMRAAAFSYEYVKRPDGETAQIIDRALSGDARAREKLRGTKRKRKS